MTSVSDNYSLNSFCSTFAWTILPKNYLFPLLKTNIAKISAISPVTNIHSQFSSLILEYLRTRILAAALVKSDGSKNIHNFMHNFFHLELWVKVTRQKSVLEEHALDIYNAWFDIQSCHCCRETLSYVRPNKKNMCGSGYTLKKKTRVGR